jgi:hypothetical protein
MGREQDKVMQPASGSGPGVADCTRAGTAPPSGGSTRGAHLRLRLPSARPVTSPCGVLAPDLAGQACNKRSGWCHLAARALWREAVEPGGTSQRGGASRRAGPVPARQLYVQRQPTVGRVAAAWPGLGAVARPPSVCPLGVRAVPPAQGAGWGECRLVWVWEWLGMVGNVSNE